MLTVIILIAPPTEFIALTRTTPELMAARPDNTEARPPLNPVDFMVLLVLSDGERHGYALVREMDERTNGRISLLPGNLYVVLRRLLRDELIAECPGRTNEKHRGRPRRYYEITPTGRELAAAEMRRLKELVEAADGADLMGERT